MGLFRFIKKALRLLRRALTGEILDQIDTPIIGGVGVISLLLKRERRSGDIYVVFVGQQSWYYPIDLDEFDRFIEAADGLRALQTSAITPREDIRISGEYIDMVLTGDVVSRVEVSVASGITTASFSLKRAKNDGREYVVLALISPGTRMYYPFELDEFHRFIASAKKIRAMAQSIGTEVFLAQKEQT